MPVYSEANLDAEETVTGNTGITYQEDISKRTEFIKEYIGSDGTRMAMVYAEAVHYFDEETDAWEEVDNCLEYSATGNRYTSNNDKFKVSFAGDKNSGELVQVLNDEYKLSWEVSVISSMSMTNLKDQKIQRKNNVSKYSIDIDQQSLEKKSDNDIKLGEKPQAVGISSRLEYSDIFDDASNISEGLIWNTQILYVKVAIMILWGI